MLMHDRDMRDDNVLSDYWLVAESLVQTTDSDSN